MNILIGLGFCLVIGAVFGTFTGVVFGAGAGWGAFAVAFGFSCDVLFKGTK